MSWRKSRSSWIILLLAPNCLCFITISFRITNPVISMVTSSSLIPDLRSDTALGLIHGGGQDIFPVRHALSSSLVTLLLLLSSFLLQTLRCDNLPLPLNQQVSSVLLTQNSPQYLNPKPQPCAHSPAPSCLQQLLLQPRLGLILTILSTSCKQSPCAAHSSLLTLFIWS